MNSRTQKGSALYIVLIFSIISFTAASVYIISQVHFARVSRTEPARVQALLNARSGIWYGLAMLNKEIAEKSKQVDTVGIDTSKSGLFGEDLFEEGQNTEDTSAENYAPAAGDTVTTVLFDSTVIFSNTLVPSFVFRMLESEGICRKYHKKASVTIASKQFSASDTVLFLSTPTLPEGAGRIDGKIAYLEQSIDKSDTLQRKRFFVDMEELRKNIETFQGPLSSMMDSAIKNMPVTIQYDEDFEKLTDTVHGPLFIDGTHRDLVWREKRTIYVTEELQITGNVHIENLTFITGGDIKLLDEAKLKAVELFSSSRIFFSGESVFYGNAMACGDIEIYEEARIVEKSILISTGISSKKDQKPDGTNEVNQGNEQSGQTQKQEQQPFSLYVRDRAQVDGILIDLRRLGGISTDFETEIKGIVWAEGRVCHRGRITGVIKADVLVSDAEPLKVTGNYLDGSIKKLESINEYYMPYFFGNPAIIEWTEE